MRNGGAPALGFGWSAPRYAVGALMIVVVLMVNAEVGLRFLFNFPLDAISEIVLLLFPWLSLLGAAVAVGTSAHMSLQLLDGRLTGRSKAAVEVFVAAATIAFSVFLIVQGLNYSAMRLGEVTNVLGISRSWEVLAFPVSGVLIIAYSVRSMLLRGRRNTVAANAAGLDQF
jgi:TRAP-type C4-dicarboxylate transport system permease small subunit